MVNNIPIPEEQLSSMYAAGKSMMDISKYLKCSVHKVVYWMTKYKIKRRSLSEAVYLAENPGGDPFNIKTHLSLQEQHLFGLGLGLYWGEGEKTSKASVRLANSDPNLILIFREFLISICQVDSNRIHYYIICFNDSNVEEVRRYWAKTLNTSEEKFGKIVQIPPQGKGTYRKKSKCGVCTLVVSNTKLKLWMMQELARFSKVPR